MQGYKAFLEEYIDSIKYGRDVYDVYKNPSKKDFKELKASVNNSYGFRIILDMAKQNAYFADAAIYHWKMLESDVLSKELRGFNRESLWYDAKDAHRYLLIGTDTNNKGIQSDTVQQWKQQSLKTIKKGYIGLESMLDQNLSWVKKYGISDKELKSFLEGSVQELKDEFGVSEYDD
jgi:hypothetical protein